jgi:hypothetical protein
VSIRLSSHVKMQFKARFREKSDLDGTADIPFGFPSRKRATSNAIIVSVLGQNQPRTAATMHSMSSADQFGPATP